MKDKSVLRVKKPINETMVAMGSSHTLFIDEEFYLRKFGEDINDSSLKAFPVEIVCLRIDWIINTQQGLKFLQAINQSDRLDFYEIRTLKVIIEYLYKRSKTLMLVFLLPLYIVQLCLFVLSIFYTNMAENAELSEDDDAIAEYYKKSRISVVFNQIMTVIMLVIMACVYRYTGKKYIYRVFTWFDITFYTLNTIANF